MVLSELIKNYRKEHNLSQKAMAEHCHCSVSTIVKLEKPGNTSRPSTLTLWKLSQHMGLTEKDLLKILADDNMPFFK